MSIMRNRLTRRFVTLPTELIRDENISDRAKLLYAYFVSKPDCYGFSYRELLKDTKLKTRLTLWKYIKELSENGWISRQKLTDARGMFVGGEEFVLHETRYVFRDNLKQKDVFKEFDKTSGQYYTIEEPEADMGEDYGIELESNSLPNNKDEKFMLVTTFKAYNSGTLFGKNDLILNGYLLKRFKRGSKYKDFMFLGEDIKNVSLTVADVNDLLLQYDKYKVWKMIKLLDEWFDKKENKRYLKVYKNRSCKDFFEKRKWLEEKVKQDLIRERNRSLKEREK